MQSEMQSMWAAKLGLDSFNAELFSELETLMVQTPIDYTIFFRELSMVPDNIEPLKASFYKYSMSAQDFSAPAFALDPDHTDKRWAAWLSLIHLSEPTRQY